MKKSYFFAIVLLFSAFCLSSCEPDRVVKVYGNTNQYNDEFTIRASAWQWDNEHYNWFYTFEDYKIMDRYLMDYASVTAYEVLYDERGNRVGMRALPYSTTWWDSTNEEYYTTELSYEFGRGWIMFTFTDSFHDPNFAPGDMTIRVCVMDVAEY